MVDRSSANGCPETQGFWYAGLARRPRQPRPTRPAAARFAAEKAGFEPVVSVGMSVRGGTRTLAVPRNHHRDAHARNLPRASGLLGRTRPVHARLAMPP